MSCERFDTVHLPASTSLLPNRVEPPDIAPLTYEDRSVSMGRANVWALLALGPVVSLLTILFVSVHGWDPIVRAGDTAPVLLLLALVAGILLHEVLHALAWKVAGGMPWGDVKLGFQWKTLTPYAHARVPMPARVYRIGAATPGVLLGLAPALAGLAVGDGLFLLFGLLFTFAAGGDALILWLLRGVAPTRLVQDHPNRAGCLVLVGADDGSTRPGDDMASEPNP